ncbi:MAG: GNAT family N-acetyltransferase [Clostridiales bacterium]|nr:GNAT family N-acetyltransferase [Clostridiales bacterium]
MFRIREATEEDYAAICRLNSDEMGYEYSPEKTKEKLRKLLGQRSDKILVCKKKGIGRALLDEIEERAKKDGAAGIRLVSGITRSGAHEFYQRCGYGDGREQNIRRGHFSRRHLVSRTLFLRT